MGPASERRKRHERGSSDRRRSLERARTGMRLQKCEVLNWGTFDGRVWGLDRQRPQRPADRRHWLGQVDARRRHHDAARPAAEDCLQQGGRRRSPRAQPASRMFSATTSPSAANAGYGRRAGGACATTRRYSVILGRFRNEAFDQDVTLGAGFLARGPAGPAGALVRRRRPAALDRRAFRRTSAATSPRSRSGCALCRPWRSMTPFRRMARPFGAASESRTSRRSTSSTRPSP